MRGFFSEDEGVQTKLELPLFPGCGACGAYRNCNTPKFPSTGLGRKRILIVGDSPSKKEDEKGKLLKGDHWKLLESALGDCNVDLHKDCLFTNAMICHPNKTDRVKATEHCRPNLFNLMKKEKPVLTILLGYRAIQSVMGHCFRPKIGNYSRWVGFQIPNQSPNTWVCPTYHPYEIPVLDKTGKGIFELHFRRHIKEAIANCVNYPWKKQPEFKKRVRVVHDEQEVCRIIRKYNKGDSCAYAWDYETNQTKPDNQHSFIYCAAFCFNGTETIAFPWTAAIANEVRKLLSNPKHAKFAANIKFEYRWTIKHLGITPADHEEDFDVVLGAHILDNRANIAGLKFQSFINYGQRDYSEHVSKYLRSTQKGGYQQNRIKECDFTSLMIYCGLDALFTYKITIQQKEKIKWRG